LGANSSAPGDSKGVLNMYTTPKGAFFLHDRRDVLYFHTLFALKDQNLGAFEANFVTLVLNMFVNLENKWEAMCDVIEKGNGLLCYWYKFR
jgi:auxin responsive GH3 family protein